jgi:hypothetical protein
VYSFLIFIFQNTLRLRFVGPQISSLLKSFDSKWNPKLQQPVISSVLARAFMVYLTVGPHIFVVKRRDLIVAMSGHSKPISHTMFIGDSYLVSISSEEKSCAIWNVSRFEKNVKSDVPDDMEDMEEKVNQPREKLASERVHHFYLTETESKVRRRGRQSESDQESKSESNPEPNPIQSKTSPSHPR